MPLISEEDYAAQQSPLGMRPVGHPQGLTVTRHEWSPPISEGGTPQSDAMGYKETPTSGEMWRSAFEQENDVYAVARRMIEPSDYGPADPEHNPLDVIKGTPAEEYRDRFLTSRNRAETEAIKSRIDRELDNRRILDASGWAGIGSQMAAGLLSPTVLLPFGTVARGFQVGPAMAKTMMRTGAWAAGGIGLQELALHSAQETRTLNESLLAVGGGFVLGSLLGAGASAFKSHQLAKASRQIDADLATIRQLKADAPTPRFDPEGIPFGRPATAGDVGAAASRTVQENRLAGAFGLEKAFRRFNPLSRMIGSENRAARDAATRMAEMPMMLEQNKSGIPTGPEGGSVESRIKIDGDTALYRMQETMHRAFSEHRFQEPNAWFSRSRAWIEGNGPGKLGYADFKKEVTKALRSETADGGIQHPIPEVKEAAEAIRKDVFNYFKDEAIKLGLFPKDVDFLAGYVMRRYDVPKILTEHTRFRDILVDWLQKGQAKAQRELANLESQLRAKQGEAAASAPEISKLKSAIEDLKARWAVDPEQANAYAEAWRTVQKGEPPVAPGHVRVWHGGIAQDGKRWISTDRAYAEGYRDNGAAGKSLWYLDLPEGDKRINNPDWPDQGVKQGFTFNFELPEAEAHLMRRMDVDSQIRADLEASGALGTQSERNAHKLITAWLRDQSALERGVRADLAEDRARLADLDEQLSRATSDEERKLIQDEIDKINSQIGDVQAALNGLTERRPALPRGYKDAIGRRVASGETYRVPDNLVDEQIAAASRYTGALPSRTRIGALSRIEPSTEAESVAAIFRLADGTEFSQDILFRELANARALYLRSIDAVVFPGLARGQTEFKVSGGGHVGEGHIAGGVYHEAVHARWSGLDPVIRDRLVAHADVLGVLDMQLGTFLRAINDPTWKGAGANDTLREAYSTRYRGATDLQDRLNQEAVAHLQELAYVRFFTDEELSPVLDDLAMLRGEGAEVAPRVTAETTASASDGAMSAMRADETQSLPPVERTELGFATPDHGARALLDEGAERLSELQKSLPSEVMEHAHKYRFNAAAMIDAVAAEWATASEKALRPLLDQHKSTLDAVRSLRRDVDNLAAGLDKSALADQLAKAAQEPRPADPAMMVYHGTSERFEKYSGEIARSRSEAASDIGVDTVFVTPDKEFASRYGTPMPLELKSGFYFDIENMSDLARLAPFINSKPDAADFWQAVETGAQTWGLLESRGIVSELKRLGYDGVRMTEEFRNAQDRPRMAGTLAVFSQGKVVHRGTGQPMFALGAGEGPPGNFRQSGGFDDLMRVSAQDAETGQSMRRDLDALGYYSQALEAAKSWNQKKGTPEQALMWLKKSGVKDAEIEATGLKAFLDGKKSVTQEEVVGHLEASRVGLSEVNRPNEAADAETLAMQREMRELGERINELNRQTRNLADDSDEAASIVEELAELRGRMEELHDHDPYAGAPSWRDYSLDPSNPTYRETVLHLPERGEGFEALDTELNRLVNERDDIEAGIGDISNASPEQLAAYDDVAARIQQRREALRQNKQETFRSGHFSEPNIIGHMMTSMTTHRGRPVYTIDQIQSDWGQKLRDDGAKDDAKIADLKRRYADAEAKRQMVRDRPSDDPERQKAFEDANLLRAELSTAEASAPGNPLVNTTDQWVNTTLRRAIRQAAEADAEYIAIPSGDTVLSYNPGDTAGMRGFYGSGERAVSAEAVDAAKAWLRDKTGKDPDDEWGFSNGSDYVHIATKEFGFVAPTMEAKPIQGIVPKNLRNLLQKIDKASPGPERIDTLDSPSGKTELGRGFSLFPLSETVKRAVLSEGQPMFAARAGDDASRGPSVSPDVWNMARQIGGALGVEVPEVAAKSFDDQIEALEKFLRKVEAASQKAGRSASDDMQSILAQIDDVKRFADADRQELEGIANETISTITGAPAGRMINPFDSIFLEGKSGPLQARTLKVPDLFVSDKGHAFADFLDDDIERISASYVRSMSPDVAIAREFGDINLKETLRQIQEDADNRTADVPDGPQSKSIQDEARRAQNDLIAITKRLRGTYNVGQDPSDWGPWTARRVKELNVLRLMGSVLAASISDPMKLLMVHGFRNNFDLFSTFLTNIKGARLSMNQAKEMSAGLELVMSRAGQLWDAFDDFGGHSKFDRAMDGAVRKFGRLTMMDQWNSTLKQLSGSMTASRVLRASVDLANGRISKANSTRLAKSGISPEMAQEIAAQYQKHGGMHGRLWLANAGEWDKTDMAQRAANALRAAVRKEADITIVTPGQERPLWTSGTYGSVLAQFRTFQLVTVQRTLIPAMQESNAAVFAGIAGMIALGMLSERLKMLVHGKEDKGPPKDMGEWLYAGLANGGVLGWITDVDQTMHKATRGNISAARLLFGSDRPISRFASQNVTGSMLGPTFGAGQDLVTAFGGATTGDISQGDVRAMRRLLPYQNLFWISRALRAGEEQMMSGLGVPQTRRN